MGNIRHTIDRAGVYEACANVIDSNDEMKGIITFSLRAYAVAQGGGGVFLNLSPDDAEVLASMLLNAAIERRYADTKEPAE